MISVVITTLIIVSPVAGYISIYKWLYGRMPCDPVNNIFKLNKIGAEVVEDTIEPEQDNNIIFFNNNIIVEQDNNNIRIEEVDIGV